MIHADIHRGLRRRLAAAATPSDAGKGSFRRWFALAGQLHAPETASPHQRCSIDPCPSENVPTCRHIRPRRPNAVLTQRLRGERWCSVASRRSKPRRRHPYQNWSLGRLPSIAGLKTAKTRGRRGRWVDPTLYLVLQALVRCSWPGKRATTATSISKVMPRIRAIEWRPRSPESQTSPTALGHPTPSRKRWSAIAGRSYELRWRYSYRNPSLRSGALIPSLESPIPQGRRRRWVEEGVGS